MKAVTWHGKRDVRVEEVADPVIVEPTDAIIQVTTTNICGSDLHLYEPLAAFMGVGDVLGHEAMGALLGGNDSARTAGWRLTQPVSCAGEGR